MPYSSLDGRIRRWRLDLQDTTPTALRHLRRWITNHLISLLDDAHLADVLLVAVELATNAYQHGNGPHRVRLHHHDPPCRVLVEVDDNATHSPHLAPPAARTARGHGLVLVEALSHRWGVLHHRGGKTVWAEVHCDNDPGSRFRST
jgi:anti-sigma regulatory factor (Ser/Thr protein kinase)